MIESVADVSDTLTVLDELQEAGNALVRATAARNELIVAARLDGYPWASIADVTGLTVSGVEKVAMRLNGGRRPVPRQRVQ